MDLLSACDRKLIASVPFLSNFARILPAQLELDGDLMFTTILMIGLRASLSEVPVETPQLTSFEGAWSCSNQVEVWCAADGCAASKPGEFTPIDIVAKSDGSLSVCAYTGCWEGVADLMQSRGRLVWIGDNLSHSANPAGEKASVSVLIDSKDGVGFVRVGGLATPLLCESSPSLP